MKSQPAYVEFAVSHGGNTVCLRPTLRAATTLEALEGFETLFRKVDQFDTGTIRTIIEATSSRGAADALLTALAQAPLAEMARATHAPVIAVCRALLDVAASGEEAKRSQPAQSAKPLPWSDLYRDLFGYATGWLGWSPDQAWAATPQEIATAFQAYTRQLQAIHGSGDTEETTKENTQDQRAANEAAGLDPEFDRQGLHALKAKMQGGM